MPLETIILILSPVSIFTFALFELGEFNPKRLINNRLGVAITMELLSKSLAFILSSSFLLTFVNFVAPLEILSISRLNIPQAMNFLLSLLLIDFFHYLSHRLHHAIPLLWRFHRLHHADRMMNAITTFIHHPMETLTVFIIDISMYVLFDVPVIAILCHSLLMAIHAPFSHTSVKIPMRIQTLLGYFMVTPHMHRTHHSRDIKEGNSSFSIVFPFWDRLCGTYIPQSELDLKKMKFGVRSNESPRQDTVGAYLVNPLLK